jgi:FtsP/CotA-like multicopper oxidase with cupredoxin domain
MKSQTKACAQSAKSEGEGANGSAGSASSDSLGSRQDRNNAWTRRTFLLGTALTGGSLLATQRVTALDLEQHEGVGRGHQDIERYPLQVPIETPPVMPLLTCAPALVNMGDGKMRGVLAYNGRFPGPTWVARTGDWVMVTLQNKLSEPTITHWHGLITDYQNDGGPRLSIGPDQFYDYNFPILQRAGLNFYHPHPHMLTGEQVCLGLAGAFIIRDAEEDALKLPAGPYEVPLVIRDASFDSQGNLTYNPTTSGFKGKFPLVNGTLNPMLNVDRGVYRFRVLNGANARVFRLALSNGASFTVIGNDGGLLQSPQRGVSEIELGMGERLDLLVDFSALGSGQSVTLRCLTARWDLIAFVGTGTLGVAYSPPATLSTIAPLSGPSQPTRTFTFDGMSRINGLEYDLNRIDFRVPFGITERWRFQTGGNAPHPVHVHGTSFQVVSRTGGRAKLFPWEGGWKDTVLLNDKETVDVLIRFNGYRGLYVMHCHQLEHESMGMMSNFEVF